MSGHLAIVAYKALVDGVRTGSIDFQVRWFPNDDPNEVKALLMEDRFQRYKNPEGEDVCWELIEVLAIEPFDPKEPGEEVAGFIASTEELTQLCDCRRGA